MKRCQFLSSAVLLSSRSLLAQAPKIDMHLSEVQPAALILRSSRVPARSGVDSGMTEKYLAEALIPALNRLGISPVGAFDLEFGLDSPASCLLLSSTDSAALLNTGSLLPSDNEYLAKADAFWNAPESRSPVVRIQSELLRAFAGWPKLVLPPAKSSSDKRVFQVRS